MVADLTVAAVEIKHCVRMNVLLLIVITIPMNPIQVNVRGYIQSHENREREKERKEKRKK